MANQYKVVSFKRDTRIFKDNYYPEVIEEALNQYYDEGWSLKTIIAPGEMKGHNYELLAFLEKRK
jgi:hypothetical protein